MRLIKVCLIGPKTYAMGGHDFTNPTRTELRKSIAQILKQYQDEDTTILGITALGLGSDQDFAISCITMELDYTVYLPYKEPDSYWSHIPGLEEIYAQFIQKALEIKCLSQDRYSPKRYIDNQKRMIKDSNVIIFVKDNIFEPIDALYQYAHKHNKIVHEINV